VLVGVSGRGDCLHGKAAEVGPVTVAQAPVLEAAVSVGRREDGGAVVGGELAGAAEEIRVQVRVRDIRHAQAASPGGGPQGP
jgi:hypothetical protein